MNKVSKFSYNYDIVSGDTTTAYETGITKRKEARAAKRSWKGVDDSVVILQRKIKVIIETKVIR